MPVMTKTPLGDDIVILYRAEYDALTFGRRDEDAADAARANNILADIERGTETLLTSEQANQLLEAKTPLAFWRKHRGITQAGLVEIGGRGSGLHFRDRERSKDRRCTDPCRHSAEHLRFRWTIWSFPSQLNLRKKG